jgi:hypothetical protein
MGLDHQVRMPPNTRVTRGELLGGHLSWSWPLPQEEPRAVFAENDHLVGGPSPRMKLGHTHDPLRWVPRPSYSAIHDPEGTPAGGPQ